uniref:Uncharacterized protein n=1 Tax=Oncorhynchus kisutch TaxID=8019 RepID=A0A8C7LX50_ONCKI
MSTQSIFKPVTHVLFDMDELLLGCTRCHTREYKAMEASTIIRDSLERPMTPEELLSETRKIQERILPSAGLAAGMQVEATLVLRTMEDFKPDMFSLPAYD